MGDTITTKVCQKYPIPFENSKLEETKRPQATIFFSTGYGRFSFKLLPKHHLIHLRCFIGNSVVNRERVYNLVKNCPRDGLITSNMSNLIFLGYGSHNLGFGLDFLGLA